MLFNSKILQETSQKIEFLFSGISELETRIKKIENILREKEYISSSVPELEERIQRIERILRKMEDGHPGGTCESWENSEAGDRRVLMIDGVEIALRYCPPGDFTMGSPDAEVSRSENEIRHDEKIDEGFWICETPITQEQWSVVGGQKANDCFFEGAKLPVETVDWNESFDFTERLNRLGITPEGWRWRLPTEQQWEYACRAGTSGETYGFSLDKCAWYGKNSGGKTHEVGQKLPNKWGIYDMLGNVWEWTKSKYEEEEEPRYIDQPQYVDRGGAWTSDMNMCRPANRNCCEPQRIDNNFGFRVVLVKDKDKD